MSEGSELRSRVPLRILQTVASTDRRGAEIFGVHLGSSLRRRGHAVQTWALAPGARRPALDVPSLAEGSLSLRGLRRLRHLAGQADVVIGHGSRTLPANALATVGLPVPVVYRSIGDPSFWGDSVLRRARAGAFFRQAAAIVVVWQGAARMLQEMYRVPGERIRVIPRGVPAEHFSPASAGERAASREQLGLDPDAEVVIYLGALSPEKNPAGAIRAVAQLPGVWLLLVGDGRLRTELENLAERLLPGRARFLGRESDPRWALAAADALVLPSRTEGTPGVVIEAGLMGIPTVATGVGGVPEVVVDGRTGLLVAPDDTAALAGGLRGVLDDPAALGSGARASYLERFELGVVSAAWDRFLRALVESRPLRRPP